MKEIEYHNKYIFAIITLEKWSEYKNILTYTMFIAARCCCVIVVVLLSGVCVTNPGDQRPAPAPMLLVSADGRHKCGREQPQPGPGSFGAILGRPSSIKEEDTFKYKINLMMKNSTRSF